MFYLSSKTKKIIFGCLFASLLIIGLILMLTSNKGDNKKEEGVNVAKNTEATAGDLSSDSDNDGLRDWEEALWKTDPKNPDTDGDGISDGEEANASREVLIEEYKANNEFPEKAVIAEPAPQTSTEQEPKTQPKVEQNEFKIYGNIAGKVLKARGAELVYELDAFKKLGSTMTAEEFDSLKISGDKYLNTSINLTLISPPKEMETLHRNLIMSYSNIAEAIHEMASYKERGIVPVEIVLDYNKTALGIGENILPIVKFFKDKGIKFGANEDGYIFVNPFDK